MNATLSTQLIDELESEETAKLVNLMKRQKRRSKTKTPPNRSKAFNSPNRFPNLITRVLSEDFHENLIAGKPGTFEDLIMFLRDQTKNHRTIGLKNHYLKFLKKYPLTKSQADAVRQLIWDYANSNQFHRSRLFGRLAIRVSTPQFHLAISDPATNATRMFVLKMQRLKEYLDHHSPETKPTTT